MNIRTEIVLIMLFCCSMQGDIFGGIIQRIDDAVIEQREHEITQKMEKAAWIRKCVTMSTLLAGSGILYLWSYHATGTDYKIALDKGVVTWFNNLPDQVKQNVLHDLVTQHNPGWITSFKAYIPHIAAGVLLNILLKPLDPFVNETTRIMKRLVSAIYNEGDLTWYIAAQTSIDPLLKTLEMQSQLTEKVQDQYYQDTLVQNINLLMVQIEGLIAFMRYRLATLDDLTSQELVAGTSIIKHIKKISHELADVIEGSTRCFEKEKLTCACSLFAAEFTADIHQFAVLESPQLRHYPIQTNNSLESN